MLKHVTDIGKYFIKELKSIKSSSILDVRGQGLMIGVEVKENRNVILKKLQEEKILAIPAGEMVVRFLPPYIIEKKHVDLVINVLKKVL